MNDQIKPRYRLGTQHMLDLAKDDATKIPERTLFRLVRPHGTLAAGTVVVRNQYALERGHDDVSSVSFRPVYDLDFANSNWEYRAAEHLQPLI